MSRAARFAVLALSVALLLCVAVPFWNWIPDDAYISFEYARNFAGGNGLVFNPGERVEGFSNLLWTLGLALGARLGASIELISRAVSLAAAVISLWLMLLLFERVVATGGSNGPRTTLWPVATAMFASATFFPLAFYATAGLETTFYLCLLLAGAVCHLGARPGWQYVSHAAFLAAALCRPEGIMFLVVNVIFVMAGRRAGALAAPRIGGAAALAVYAAVMAVKHQYFGGIVPNTCFAKPGASLSYREPLSRGLRYLVRFFVTSGAVLLLPFAWLAATTREKRYPWFYIGSFAVCQLGFIVYVGADVLRFDRFAVPLFPWLVTLALMGVTRRGPLPRDRTGAAARRLFVLAAAVIMGLSVFRAHRALVKYCDHDWMHARAQCDIGRFLGPRGALGAFLPEDGTIVTNEIGAIRYYSGRPVIDMLGLTDKTVSAIRYESFQTYGIGSSPWSAVTVSRYLLDRDPACVIIPSTGMLSLHDRTVHRRNMHPLWYAIFTDPRLESNYRALYRFTIHPQKYLYLFVRDDIEINGPASPLPTSRCLETEYIGR
ncbi:MAG: hypothetical protein P8181_05045 [bacterium]